MLSGTSLVSPRNGLAVFCLMQCAGACSRLVRFCLLEVYPVAVEGKLGGQEDRDEVGLMGLEGRIERRVGYLA